MPPIPAGQLAGSHEAACRQFARDLHDTCGQHVTALRFHLESLCARTAGSAIAGDVERVHALAVALDRSLDAVARQLRPPLLDHGLGPALARLAAEWSGAAGVGIDASGLDEAIPALRDDVALHLYRCAQESLQNVAKHARARSVRLRLLVDDAAVCLAVEDDGVGFSPAAAAARRRAGGYGHTCLQERASAIGGTVQVHTVPGRGTSVTVLVPMTAAVYEPVFSVSGAPRVVSSSSRIRP